MRMVTKTCMQVCVSAHTCEVFKKEKSASHSFKSVRVASGEDDASALAVVLLAEQTLRLGIEEIIKHVLSSACYAVWIGPPRLPWTSRNFYGCDEAPKLWVC